jgi:hypothetical protein
MTKEKINQEKTLLKWPREAKWMTIFFDSFGLRQEMNLFDRLSVQRLRLCRSNEHQNRLLGIQRSQPARSRQLEESGFEIDLFSTSTEKIRQNA